MCSLVNALFSIQCNQVSLFIAGLQRKQQKLQKHVAKQQQLHAFLKTIFIPSIRHRKAQCEGCVDSSSLVPPPTPAPLPKCSSFDTLQQDSSLVPPPASPPLPKRSSFDTLQQEIKEIVSQSFIKDLEVKQRELQAKDEEIAKLKKQNKELLTANDKLRNKLCVYEPRRINQTLKRKDTSVRYWRSKYRNLVKKSDSVLSTEQKVQELTQNLRKVKRNKRVQKQRQLKSQEAIQSKVREIKRKSSTLVAERQEEIMCIENDLEVAQENIASLKQKSLLNTKMDGKTYAYEIRKASYCLQNMGVAQHNVGQALQTVTKAITNKDGGKADQYVETIKSAMSSVETTALPDAAVVKYLTQWMIAAQPILPFIDS